VDVALPRAHDVSNGRDLTESQPPDPVPLISIRCFGSLEIRSGERTLSPVGKSGPHYKAWGILIYLAAQPEGATSRERLLQTFWPDITADKSINRLNVTLHRLRTVLAEQIPGLRTEVVQWQRDGTYRLNRQVVWSDVQVFWELCQSIRTQPSEQHEQSVLHIYRLYRGDLLRDLRLECPWINERQENGTSLQEQYLREYCRVVRRLAQTYVTRGKPDLAAPLFRAILTADPGVERAARSLYQCYRQMGDRVSLVRDHQWLKQRLREIYGEANDPTVDPELSQLEPETVALYEEILATLSAERLGTGVGAASSQAQLPKSSDN